ncbi:hypothetical protein OHA03_12745 [Streptomyces sp. NBC_00154]|nr:hypothetical protein [Streptomyces sp. NBC_00154]
MKSDTSQKSDNLECWRASLAIELGAKQWTVGVREPGSHQGRSRGVLPSHWTDAAGERNVIGPLFSSSTPGPEDHVDPGIVIPVLVVVAVREVDGIRRTASVDEVPRPFNRSLAAVTLGLAGLPVRAKGQ